MTGKGNAIKTKQLNVLYVEDDKNLIESMQFFLNRTFNKSYIAIDGLDGLDVFKTNINDIDLIITDIDMPGINGIEMIEEIRKLNANIPIYVTSAEDEYKPAAMELNVIEFFQKPIIDLFKIAETINKNFS